MKLRSYASKSSEEVLKNLPRQKKEVVYLKIYESQYPRMLKPKLLKQVQFCSVRIKRENNLPPQSFNFSYEYPTAAGNVKVTVPVITGGPWRFDAVPGVKIPEVTKHTPYHITPLHAMPCTVPQALVPGYRCQISPTFPAWQLPKFPSDS